MFCESKLGLIKLNWKTNCFTYSSSLIHPSLFELYHHNFQILQLCSKYGYEGTCLHCPLLLYLHLKPSGYYLECPSIDHQALRLWSHILLQLYIKYIKPFGFLFFFLFFAHCVHSIDHETFVGTVLWQFHVCAQACIWSFHEPSKKLGCCYSCQFVSRDLDLHACTNHRCFGWSLDSQIGSDPVITYTIHIIPVLLTSSLHVIFRPNNVHACVQIRQCRMFKLSLPCIIHHMHMLRQKLSITI